MRGVFVARLSALFLLAGSVGCGELVHDVGEVKVGEKASDRQDSGRSGAGGSVAADAAGQDDVGDSGGTGPDPSPDGSLPDAGEPAPEEDPLDPGCEGFATKAEPRRLDIYIMMDATLTLQLPALWESASLEIARFVDDPGSRGIGVGINFFGFDCDENAYITPLVGIDLLPDNAQAIKDARPAFPASTFPVLQALRGAIAHCRVRGQGAVNANTKQVVFLIIADGTVNPICAYTPEQLNEAVEQGFSGKPSIETFLFGLDALDFFDPAQLRALLEQVVLPGGTLGPFLFGLGTNADLADKMAEARDAAMPSPCDYRYPIWYRSGALGNPDWVTLQYTYPGGDPVRVPRVIDRSDCDPLDNGWYFDDPDQPSRVIACDQTCEILTSEPAPQAEIIVGCAPPIL